jgi:pimeloyl-ACP methyl ester carboxylesterase
MTKPLFAFFHPAAFAWFCLLLVVPVTSILPSLRPLVHATEPAKASAGSLTMGLVEALRSEMVVMTPGIVMSEPSHASDSSKLLIVLVPGLLAREGSMDAIQQALRERHYSTALLHYASHEGISNAADLLAKELRLIRQKQPKRRVILVTHSMGGLVARACLENESNNPGNVTQLIMIAPPNHGSAVAGLSASELATTFAWPERIAATELKTIDEAVGGFFGRAKQELRPDSEILGTLNAHPIASNIRYSVIAGTGGPIQGELIEMSLLVGGLLFGDDPEAKASLQNIAQLAKLDEWTRGRGDGVVSLQSARLNGVNDFISLPFAHNDFGSNTSGATALVIAEILQRLATHTDSSRDAD